MTEPASRPRGTAARTPAPFVPPGSDSTPRRAPGHEALRTTLGEDGYQRLLRQRHERGTALGELADLVFNTAAEADRLHGKLRRHAAHARDRLGDLFNPHLDPAFVSVTGLLQNTGHTTDLHAARFAQQMNQLTQVLDSYLAAARRTGL
ncbi:hypothetical protein J7F01_08580 [Streptomyces sp. ISL-22]|uniref:hypothetical protein n=1 Tax=unclassified Streptomyces TaxID=2593676 RepID=UPI001BE66415|nr:MULTISPECIES: hypothetical protein [unclassified Streptomyces]MBT2418068.1 hypothetical protein [Streptomyces sp. ISL-24]MBT2432257.1 hypothetical protein [Streptomyces sp. ISL-22]